ncbi:MAG: SH3 domain-containing protein [archaeon]|nr:SH3 domain-containing protein [archaeon]
MGICQSKLERGETHAHEHAASAASETSPLVFNPPGTPIVATTEGGQQAAAGHVTPTLSQDLSSRPSMQNPQQVLIDHLRGMLTTGHAANWDHSTIDVSQLSRTLEAPQNISLLERNEAGKKALLEARIILNLRLCLLANDWKMVADQVAICRRIGFSCPEVSDAQAELEYWRHVDQVCDSLRAALAEFDLEQLLAALEKASTLKMPGREDLLSTSRKASADWKHALVLVGEATRKKDALLLTAALNYCQMAQFSPQAVCDAAVLLAKIQKIHELATIGLQYVEKSPLLVAISEASALQYHHELIVRSQHLLDLKGVLQHYFFSLFFFFFLISQISHLPPFFLFFNLEDQFLRSQYQAALAHQNQLRADRISVKMKVSFFKLHLDSFDWKKFPFLRSPDEFSSSYLFGKRKCAQSMLVWSDTLPNSLLKLTDRQLLKLSARLFHLIRAFMDELPKKKSGSANPAQEVINIGFANIEIRTEIYCQLFKQLTDNKHAASRKRGMDLLALVMQTFSPSKEFDPYLESFCHAMNTDGPNIFLSMVHDTQFGYHRGARSSTPPGVSELALPSDYIPCIMPDAPTEIDPSFVADLKQRQPECLQWIAHTPLGAQVERVLSYDMPEGLWLASPEILRTVRPSPNLPKRRVAMVPETSSQPTSSDPASPDRNEDAMLMPVVDIEALLEQWDELASVHKNQEEPTVDFTSDSDSEDERYEVEALYEFSSSSPGKISLAPGAILTVSTRPIEGGWLMGTNGITGEKGYFPESFVKRRDAPA